jgi:hypothetical protein
MTRHLHLDIYGGKLFTRSYTSKVTGVSEYLLKKWENEPNDPSILKPNWEHFSNRALYSEADVEQWRKANHGIICKIF